MPNTSTPKVEPAVQAETTPQASQSQNANGGAANGNDGGSTYTPPATQADLDRIVENRLQRERQKYADYDQYKADSAQLGMVVAERDEYKSQLDTANAELATLRASEQKRTWANEVARETGVPADVLRGETKEEMEAHAKTLEKYVKVSAPVVSGDGKSPSAPAAVTARDQFAAALEGFI